MVPRTYHVSGKSVHGQEKSGVRAGTGQVRGGQLRGIGLRVNRSVQVEFRSGASQIRVGKCQSWKTD